MQTKFCNKTLKTGKNIMNNPFRRPKMTGEHHTSPIVHRYPGNPLLTAADVPYNADLVYNAGVTFYKGKYCIAPRVDCADKSPDPDKESNFESIHTVGKTSVTSKLS